MAKHLAAIWLPPSPRFFVSVDSKRLSFCVSLLDATLAGNLVSVDSEWDKGEKRGQEKDFTTEITEHPEAG
jgi:hypothetical protein